MFKCEKCGREIPEDRECPCRTSLWDAALGLFALWLASVLLTGAILKGQNTGVVSPQIGKAPINFSASPSTIPNTVGAALPASCSTGQTYFLTSATLGKNIYGCASGAWYLQGGSGGAGGCSTTGSSILYGDGAGGCANVTVGSNLTFAGGTLSASASSSFTCQGVTPSGGAVSLSLTGTVNCNTMTIVVATAITLPNSPPSDGPYLVQITNSGPVANPAISWVGTQTGLCTSIDSSSSNAITNILLWNVSSTWFGPASCDSATAAPLSPYQIPVASVNGPFVASSITDNAVVVATTEPFSSATVGTFTDTVWSSAAAGSTNSASAQTVYQLVNPTHYAANGSTGAVIVPPGSTVQGANGLFGGIITNATGTNAIAVQGFAYANVTGSSVWGGNFLAQSLPGLAVGATMKGIEVDVDSFNANDTPVGILVVGASANGSSRGTAYQVSALGASLTWLQGFSCVDGASSTCVAIGAQTTANNVSSQILQFGSRDSGAANHYAQFYTSPNGTVVIKPDAVNNANTLQISPTAVVISPVISNPKILGISSGGATITSGLSGAVSYTYMIPSTAANDTFCLVTLANCGGGGGSIFSSYQFGVQMAITGAGNYIQTTYPNIFTLSQTGSGTAGSPYVDSITLASQTQNYFFAAPNGFSGTPSFRAIVVADVPTLNQNTTGYAAALAGGAAGSLPYQTSANATTFLASTGYSILGSGATNPIWVTPGANSQCLMSGASSYATTIPSFQTCPAGSLSSLTAATTSNTILNGNNPQTWKWAQTTVSQAAMTFTESAASTGSGDILVQIGTFGSSTAIPLVVYNVLTGSQTLPALEIIPSWNTTGVVDAALLINPTNIASGTGSLLIDAQLGGTSQWKADKAGNSTQLGTSTAIGFVGSGSNAYLNLPSNTSHTSAVISGTYTSGGSITGTNSQTCTVTFTAPAGGTAASGTVALTGTNTIAGGTSLTISVNGSNYTSAPTAATLGNGTATCSGTATVSTTLGTGVGDLWNNNGVLTFDPTTAGTTTQVVQETTTDTTTTHVLHATATGGTGTFSAIATGDLPGSGSTTVSGQTCTLGSSCSIPRGISFSIGDPNGSALSTGSTYTDYVTVPFACTIAAYNLLVDAGTITVKFLKVATGTAIPTLGSNSISTSGVSISSGTAIHSTTVTDFTTTAVSANDIMAMQITAVSTAKFVNGVLQCNQ